MLLALFLILVLAALGILIVRNVEELTSRGDDE